MINEKKRWYKNTSVGKNELSKWTKEAAEKAGLNTKEIKITNHSMRSTAVINLPKGGVGAQQLINLTGHSSANSIKPYLQMDNEHYSNIINTLRSDASEPPAKNQKTEDPHSTAGPINNINDLPTPNVINELKISNNTSKISSLMGCGTDLKTVNQETAKQETVKQDARYHNQNCTNWCMDAFIDYQKCKRLLGDENPSCCKFKKIFTAICPNKWVERWEEQIKSGTFPVDLPAPLPASSDSTKCKKAKQNKTC